MIDKESDDFRLVLKYVTYEQIESLKHAIEVLSELMVTQLTRDILGEGSHQVISDELRRRVSDESRRAGLGLQDHLPG